MSAKLYYAASQTLFARDLRDDINGVATGAQILVTLTDKYTGVIVPDQLMDGTVQMTEVPGTPGTYSLAIPNTFTPPIGRGYQLVFTVSKGGSTVPIRKAAEVLHLVTE